jgi:hypothetical protein
VSIVCLGWGSLVWDPADLPIEQADPVETAWLVDGPYLPVEFARHSNGGRMTLVLVPDRRLVPVLWTQMLVRDLDAAKRSLAMRECRRPDRRPVTEDRIQRFVDESCGYWTRNGDSRGQCADVVRQWATRRDVEAVIWTDLPPRFNRINGLIPNSEEVIEFLRHREGQELQNAMEYIRKAPKQISTEYRSQIEEQLQWMPTGIV